MQENGLIQTEPTDEAMDFNTASVVLDEEDDPASPRSTALSMLFAHDFSETQLLAVLQSYSTGSTATKATYVRKELERLSLDGAAFGLQAHGRGPSPYTVHPLQSVWMPGSFLGASGPLGASASGLDCGAPLGLTCSESPTDWFYCGWSGLPSHEASGDLAPSSQSAGGTTPASSEAGVAAADVAMNTNGPVPAA